MGLLGPLKRLVGIKDGTAGVDSAGSPGVDGGSPDPTAFAEQFAEDVTQSGYELDFTPESLATLDDVVAELPPEAIDEVGRAITAYLGEVFVRHYEGEWTDVGDVGLVVDLSAAGAAEDGVLDLPRATHAAIDGDSTFASVHDSTVASLDVDGPTLADDPETRAFDEDAVSTRRERAAALVEQYPDYDLDYSLASLNRLDEVMADYYDGTPDDVDREDRIARSEPGGVPEDATLMLGDGRGDAGKITAYLGEVFVRSCDGEWCVSDRGPGVSFQTEEGTVTLEPKMLVAAALEGYVSFARVRDEVVSGGSG